MKDFSNAWHLPLVFGTLVGLVVSGCGVSATMPSSSGEGASAFPSLPSLSSPPASQAPAATATAFPPVGLGTPLPVSALAPITADNVASIREVGVYGVRRIAALLAPDGKYTLVQEPRFPAGQQGEVIETDNQKPIAHLEYGAMVDGNGDPPEFLVVEAEGLTILGLNGERKVVSNLEGRDIYAAAFAKEPGLIARLACDANRACEIVVNSIENRCDNSHHPHELRSDRAADGSPWNFPAWRLSVLFGQPGFKGFGEHAGLSNGGWETNSDHTQRPDMHLAAGLLS